MNHLFLRLERESGYSGKFSAATHMQTLWQINIEIGLIEETHPDEPHSTKKGREITAKKAMENSIGQETLAYWNKNSENLHSKVL